MQNKNLKIIQIGCVFVEYDLFYITTFIKNCINEFLYKDTVLYQFLETGTSGTSYRYHSTPEILRFHPTPHFIFHLQSL